jgi:hypothetical protein
MRHRPTPERHADARTPPRPAGGRRPSRASQRGLHLPLCIWLRPAATNSAGLRGSCLGCGPCPRCATGRPTSLRSLKIFSAAEPPQSARHRAIGRWPLPAKEPSGGCAADVGNPRAPRGFSRPAAPASAEGGRRPTGGEEGEAACRGPSWASAALPRERAPGEPAIGPCGGGTASPAGKEQRVHDGLALGLRAGPAL